MAEFHLTNADAVERINAYWGKRGINARAAIERSANGGDIGIVSDLTGWEHDRTADKSFAQAQERGRAIQKGYAARRGKLVSI